MWRQQENLLNPIHPLEVHWKTRWFQYKASNSEVDEQVISQSENANSASEARIEESPIASIGVTVLPCDTSPVIFETPTDELVEGIDADVKDEKITLTDSLNPHVGARRESSECHSSIVGTLDNLIAPVQSRKTSNSEVDEQVISQSENANSSSDGRIEKSPVASSSSLPAPDPDRISALPENFRANILNFLPIEQAVATSVLSHKWKIAWKSVSSVRFCSKPLYPNFSAIHQVFLKLEAKKLQLFSLTNGVESNSGG